LLAVAFLAAALASPSSSGAAPVVKYKCTGTVTYNGHAFNFFGGYLWSWSMSSQGTCIGGVAQQLTYSTRGFTMPSCGGPYYATGSPRTPTSLYLAETTVKNPKTGGSKSFLQQWVGRLPLQINAWQPVPSRYIPIGGITGLGAGVITKHVGTYQDPVVKMKLAFTFGGEEIPGTDQPDGGAC
jgi:hypothetical protein